METSGPVSEIDQVVGRDRDKKMDEGKAEARDVSVACKDQQQNQRQSKHQ